MKIVVFLLFCGLAMPAYSLAADDPQQVTVSGTVTDAATGDAMPGVNIQVKGTSQGAITDIAGKYSIANVDRSATLVFSFIGYVSQEVAIGSRTVVDMVLAQEVTDLDEVVVVGYTTQKRANVVGSVTSLSGEGLAQIPAANINNAISGRLPGTTIIQGSGEPGQQTPRIRVRGRTNLGSTESPLVIIDGVQGRSMDELDPADIESLSVLKDASAAIYGAQAANGVILITTKKGQEGRPRLNYQFYQGFMTPTIIPDVTNAAEYATMLSEYQVANGKNRRYSDEDIALFASGEDPWEHPDTDWYGDLIEKWTGTSKHNLSIDGGNRGMNYYVSLGYKTDDAIYKASSTKYKQYNIRTKVEMPITDWLKTGLDVAGFMVNKLYPYKSANSIVGQSTRLVPTNWSFWPTGEPGPDIEYGDNPVETATFSAGKNDQKTYRLLNTLSTTVTVPFVKGLSLNGSFSFDLTNYYAKAFYQPWVLYYPQWDNAVRDSRGFITSMPLTPTLRGLSSPQNNETYSRTINQTGNFNAMFQRQFGSHNIMLYGGYEQYTSDYNQLYGFRQYYISSLIQTMNAGANQDKNTTGYSTIYARKSLIGRATYDYKGKYLAEIVFRRDGSLKFPEDGRWGNFPGFLVGWRASEEDFWKNNLGFINYFKLRGSYGKMGMDPGDPFQYMNKYGLNSGMVFGTGSSIETVVGYPSVANPNITWETQTTQNIGFDSKWFNDLITFNLDLFYNKREDILTARDASVPNFTGLTLPSENIGQVDNKGFEIEAGFHKNLSSDLRLDITGNYSFARNKIVFYDEPARVVPWQVRTGHPYGATLMYNAIGIFADEAALEYPHWANAEPGDVIFEDVSGDGKITGDDRILIDETDAPEVFYGITVEATWKDFSLQAQIQGQGKYLRRNYYDNRRGEAGNYFQWTYDNRWTPTNTNTNIARAYNRGDYYWNIDSNPSTYWYDNTAYCRLKNVVLTYTIPQNLYRGLGISRANVYVSGNNVALLWTGTKKFDPEGTSGGGAYPILKTYAIGANITF
ncbi:MAG: TonB-dependent receptor [Bacteroidales bacterium]|nr:TonB-dependent receptor [Bacteroidales bacterium]